MKSTTKSARTCGEQEKYDYQTCDKHTKTASKSSTKRLHLVPLLVAQRSDLSEHLVDNPEGGVVGANKQHQTKSGCRILILRTHNKHPTADRDAASDDA
jgi:hypothetical protein